jgi:hypothetical protein
MQTSVTLAPLLPLWFLIAILTVACATILFGAFSKRIGFALRGLALLLIALAIANPSLLVEDRTPLPTTVAVVTDRSASQSLSDRELVTDTALNAIQEQLSEFENIETRLITGAKPNEDGSNLFANLSQGLEDVPAERLGAVIMLTDGQVHDVPDQLPNQIANIPIHSLITGRNSERDRRITIRKSPRFALVNRASEVVLEVIDQGPDTGNERAQISMKRNGETILEMTVAPNTPITLPFEVARAGENLFEIEVNSINNELTDINNRAIMRVEGIREALRVLLVSGEPHAGERTWRNLLKSDAAVDLVHFTILRPPEKQDGTPINELSLIAFPTRQLFSEKIDDFDLIIFDRYQRRGVLPLLYFENIATFVRNGGALLVASGPEFAGRESIYRTTLANILPASPTGNVIETAFRTALTEDGNRHPVTRNLIEGQSAAPQTPDWAPWFRYVEADPEDGIVAMTGPENNPILSLNRVGEGRVALFLSDHVWLWARNYENGGPYLPLLRRLAHWLMQEPDLEEERLQLNLEGDTLRVVRQTMQNAIGQIRITSPDGRLIQPDMEEKSLGTFEATLQADRLGLWRAEDGNLTALAHVGPINPREYRDVISTLEKLEPVIETSNGSQRRIISGETLDIPRIALISGSGPFSGTSWIGIKTTEASELNGISRYPLAIGILSMLVLLAAWSLAWWREGR